MVLHVTDEEFSLQKFIYVAGESKLMKIYNVTILFHQTIMMPSNLGIPLE